MPVLLIAGGGTGGHLMPALAIAEAARSRGPEWEVVLVGARRGVEAALLPDRPYRHYLLPAEPIYRGQWWRNARWLWLAFRLLREAGRILDRERPMAVIGTGGYASGPMVWLAARRGIPTAIYESDAFPGLTTRWLSRRVAQVWLGVPEADRHLRPGPRTEVFVTGVPIVAPDPSARSRGLSRFGIDRSRPVVLITGGSQGSLALNQLVAQWLDQGGRGLQVVWATGPGSFERFRALHRPPWIHVVDFLDPIAEAYAVADLAVTRAGAVTIAELCAWGIPGILIPLPTAAADHQTHNARVLAEAGAAIHLPQAGLTSEILGREVERLLRSPPKREALAARARSRGKSDAVARILGRIEALIEPV